MIIGNFWSRYTNPKGLNETNEWELQMIASRLYPLDQFSQTLPDRELVLRKYEELKRIGKYDLVDRWENALGNGVHILNPKIESNNIVGRPHHWLAFDFPHADDLIIDPVLHYAGMKEHAGMLVPDYVAEFYNNGVGVDE